MIDCPSLRAALAPLGVALLLAACAGGAPNAAAPALTPTAAASFPTGAAAPAVLPAEPTLAPTPIPPAATEVPTIPAAPAISAVASSPASATIPIAPDAPAAPVTAQAGAVRFQVVANQSKAIFRVREQLARLQFPTDAVGSTGKVTGQIVVNPDGSFVSDQSKVTVDLNDLRTDDQLRDGFIKRTTLQTQRFPTAEFIPTQAGGLPSPLPDAGEHTFQVVGKMTVHGVEKEITWDVTARREGQTVTGAATTKFQFGDFGLQRPQVPVVLSIIDEIRLEVQLVAKQA